MINILTPPQTPTKSPRLLLGTPHRKKVVSINPPGYVSPAMAGNTEPATPTVGEKNTQSPKSYADVAEEALERDTDDVFDEAAIKETPPPSSLPRNHSQPRPLGEVFEEDEMALQPGSPTLRHVAGRLERNQKAKNGENGAPDYAQVVKEAEPTSPHVEEQNGPGYVGATQNGQSGASNADGAQNGHSYAEAVKEAEPTSPHVDEQNGTGYVDATKSSQSVAPGTAVANGETYADAVKDAEPTSPHVDEQNGPGARSEVGLSSSKNNATSSGNETPTSFIGMGRDDTPRSPTPKKTHKKVSSKSLNGTAKKQADDGVMQYQREWNQGVTPAAPANNGVVFEKKYRSKSGQNLVTAEAESNLENTSLQQRENKDITTEPNATRRRQRKNSELVSGRRAGAGWSNSAIRWAPANVPLQRRLQTAMVLLHTLSIAGGLAMFFLLCCIPILWPILLPYLIYVLLSSAATSGELSHRSEFLRSSRIWSLFASYFPARLHRTVPLEPTRKYIFGYHPHGIISHGAFAAFATEALGFKQLFPGITNTLLTLDANFRIPLYRDYALRMGLASVSRESCENILSKGGRNGEGMGRAITIVVGGARESLDAKPGSLKLVLKKRKGFVKLAIREGADLVPVLAFGENDIYDQFDSNSHPYVHKAQLLVKKFAGFTVPLFHARGKFLQLSPSPHPLEGSQYTDTLF